MTIPVLHRISLFRTVHKGNKNNILGAVVDEFSDLLCGAALRYLHNRYPDFGRLASGFPETAR